jgi:hypothetical protein
MKTKERDAFDRFMIKDPSNPTTFEQIKVYGLAFAMLGFFGFLLASGIRSDQHNQEINADSQSRCRAHGGIVRTFDYEEKCN